MHDEILKKIDGFVIEKDGSFHVTSSSKIVIEFECIITSDFARSSHYVVADYN